MRLPSVWHIIVTQLSRGCQATVKLFHKATACLLMKESCVTESGQRFDICFHANSSMGVSRSKLGRTHIYLYIIGMLIRLLLKKDVYVVPVQHPVDQQH